MKLKKVYIHLVIFLLLYLEFGYRMVVAQSLSGTVKNLILLMISGSLVLVKIINRQYSINQKQLLLFFWLTLICTVSFLRDQNIGNAIILWITIVTGFAFAVTVKLEDAIRAFVNVMFFLSVCSLILFTVNIVAPQLTQQLPSLGLRYSYANAEVKDAFFSVCLVNSSSHRNYGMTWEPGAFALLLCIALYCYIAFAPRFEIKKLLLFVITIVTTFSTLGYIVMGMILLTTYVPKKTERKKRKAFYIIAVFLLLTLILKRELIYELVFEKLSGLFSGNSSDLSESASARINAVKYPLLAFLRYPILGIGYDNFWYLNTTYCNSVATNTILNWFALFGPLFGAPLTYFYLRLVYHAGKYVNMGKLKLLLLLIASVFLISTESLLRVSLIYVLVFYGCLVSPFQHIQKKDSIS